MMRMLVLLLFTTSWLQAAPLPRPRSVAPYLPLPPQMEAALRDSERSLQLSIEYARRKEFQDGKITTTPQQLRRKHLLGVIQEIRYYLDPKNGFQAIGGEPLSEKLKQALRQRLEYYKMRLQEGMLDGTVARDDEVPSERPPR